MKCIIAILFTFVYLASAVPNPLPIPPPFCDNVCDGDPSKQDECQKCMSSGVHHGPGGRPPSVPPINRRFVAGSLSARQNPEPQCKPLCDADRGDTPGRKFPAGKAGFEAVKNCNICISKCMQSYPRREATIQEFPLTCFKENDWIRERAKACSTKVEDGELKDCTVKSGAPSPA